MAPFVPTVSGSFRLLAFTFLHRMRNHDASAIWPTLQPPCRKCSSWQKDGSQGRKAHKDETLTLEIPTAEDTEEVGALFAALLMEEYLNNKNDETPKGCIILLDGDLGAGKTSFARGFMRAASGDDDLRVTSPTYLLVNVYPVLGGVLEIHHMDLYRLKGDPKDFLPLNLEHVFEKCISLIEWPERLGSIPIPECRLDINLRIRSDSETNESEQGVDDDGEGSKARIMTLQPRGAFWQDRLQQVMDEGYLEDMVLSKSSNA